jgi:hypothetical protein
VRAKETKKLAAGGPGASGHPELSDSDAAALYKKQDLSLKVT